MTFRMLIDGALLEGTQRLDVIDPATGSVFASCARATRADAEAAIAAARGAFPGWADKSWADRAHILGLLADAIDARSEELAQILTAEQGKPLDQARFEVMLSAAAFRYFPSQELAPRTLADEADALILEHYRPLGVITVITPWNFPLILLSVKVAAALATGNTVVAKPAPTTPLATLLLGEIAAELLPHGVFNIIVDQNDLGALLTSHPDVAKVTFTGSTATGRKVMESAASTLKRLTLELGGNDAAIVLDDVDVDEVAPKLFSAATLNAGQVCMAAKRIFVPRALYDDVCAALGRLAEEAVVGDGRNAATTIGPIQNRMQYEKLQGLLEAARTEGRIVASGTVPNLPGYFIPPTVVRDLPDNSQLVQEEQFGPVIPVLAYDSIDEVVERANASEFGLAGTIWGKDLDRALDLAKRINTGTMWINKHLDLRFDIAFGGAKQSGIGREQGEEGLKEFVQAHVINLAKA